MQEGNKHMNWITGAGQNKFDDNGVDVRLVQLFELGVVELKGAATSGLEVRRIMLWEYGLFSRSLGVNTHSKPEYTCATWRIAI